MIITLAICLTLGAAQEPRNELHLEPIGRATTGLFDMGASEIAAYHPRTKRLFVVNGGEGMDIIDLAEPTRPARVAVRRRSNPTSVAVHGDLIALSALAKSPSSRGLVRFFDPMGDELGKITVGFGPDMVAFTPDGRSLLVACEGEAVPPKDGDGDAIDPPGSIAIVDLSEGPAKARMTELGFDSFEAQRAALVERGLRVVTPGRTLAQDCEPEYIAMSPDGRRAFVTLQENNAIAVIDLERRAIVSIEPLGFRDCSNPGMGVDAVVDGKGEPRPVPVLALPQPDSVAAFEHGGTLWLLTANEGETRTGSFDEAITWRQFTATQRATAATPREATSSPRDVSTPPRDSSAPRGDEPWQKLQVSCVPAPSSVGSMPCAFGTRSVSLWRFDPATNRISLAWDSGEAIERMVAERTPQLFNADHSKGLRVDARSASKGPEPEGLAITEVGDRRLAVITLERASAVMLLDLTDPTSPQFVGFRCDRNPEIDLGEDNDHDRRPDHWEEAGDLGPEGVLVIPASQSPTGETLVVVCNEVSGTTTIHRLRAR